MTGTNTTNLAGSPILTRPEPTSEETPASEFDRFKSFAARLVKVPKSEVDEKRKKS
jgi:hypothetical protein